MNTYDNDVDITLVDAYEKDDPKEKKRKNKFQQAVLIEQEPTFLACLRRYQPELFSKVANLKENMKHGFKSDLDVHVIKSVLEKQSTDFKKLMNKNNNNQQNIMGQTLELDRK